MTAAGPSVALVVDVANVMGSRPDGWWRDRAGAATRLLRNLDPLTGRQVTGPDGDAVRLASITAVLEGRARAATDPDGGSDPDSASGRLSVLRAEADGDTAVVRAANELDGAGERVLVVTADRGLRARLPQAAAVTGPRWLLALIDGQA